MPTLIEMFDTGYEIGESRSREFRARNAAREEFGAAADDPALFNQLQQGRSMRNNQRRQDARLDMAQDRNARQAETHEISTTEARGTQKRQATLRLINGLRAARDRGEDLGQAFDRMAPAVRELGVDPADIPDMKRSLMDDPAILDEYYAALVGDTPDGARSGGAGGGAAEDSQAALSELRKLDDITARIDRLEDPDRQDAAKSIFGLPTPGGMMRGGFGSFGTLTGRPAAGYAADLEALDGDIRSQAFETLKGGGHITEKESEFARDAIARLSRSMPYEQYRRELRDLRRYMEELKSAARRRIGGAEAPEVRPPSGVPETGGGTGGGGEQRSAPSEPQSSLDRGVSIEAGTIVPGVGRYKGTGDPTKAENYEPVEPGAARAQRGREERGGPAAAMNIGGS